MQVVTVMGEKKHLFYGKEILRDRQQDYINDLLEKFKGREVNDELTKEIWDLLQEEKNAGRVTIPFKIARRHDPSGHQQDYIEVILDTKV